MQQISACPEVSTNVAIVQAVQHVRTMRGGAQAQLMRCGDGKSYVVKFRNNPQGVRILANELIASKLGKLIGFTVPNPTIVEVGDWLIQHSPELHLSLAGRVLPFESGLHFGSEYALDSTQGRVLDWLPMELLPRLRNPEEFAGILALDKWLCNADGRQAVFYKRGRERKYTACFIDYGYCFNATEWTFPDYPLRGTFARNEVYAEIVGWDDFEPWISMMETLDENLIWTIVGGTPPTWYNSEWDSLHQLAETLVKRRSLVRDLIVTFRNSPRRPFPNWGRNQTYWNGDASSVEDDRMQSKRACPNVGSAEAAG